MSTKYFNFNNESNLTEVDVHDETGVVTFTLGEQSVEFATIGEFAEYYATARNVLPDNLKNWVLTEDGDQIAFVLRAGTAGLEPTEIAGLVAGFRAAGMSPEEIGRAMAAAQAEAVNAERAEASQVAVRNLAQEIEEFIAGLPEFAVKVIRQELGVAEVEALHEVLALDNNLFSAETYEYDEYEDDECLVTVHGIAALEVNINEMVNNVKSALAIEFPEVPAEIAFDIEYGTRTDQTEARAALSKAVFMAQVAQRAGIEVSTLDKETLDVEHIMTSGEAFQELLAESDVYKVDKTFFLVTE